MDLNELAKKWGTDKADCYHNYAQFYEKALASRKVTRLLEIGIGSADVMTHVEGYKAGASLRMWEEYFPEAEIVGLDNNREILFDEGHIKCYWTDQANLIALLMTRSWIGGGFDVIIDDGCHDPGPQIQTATAFLPLLSPGGIYVIEDVTSRNEVAAYIRILTDRKVTIEHCGKTPDDYLVVAE